MEKNDTPDRFEEFLKKTLEHYEENPPEYQWNAIQQRIPLVAPKPESGLTIRNWHWQRITTGLLFLITLVGQHYYFVQNQLVIDQKLAENTVVLKQLQEEVASLRNQLDAQKKTLENTRVESNSFVQETTPHQTQEPRAFTSLSGAIPADKNTKMDNVLKADVIRQGSSLSAGQEAIVDAQEQPVVHSNDGPVSSAITPTSPEQGVASGGTTKTSTEKLMEKSIAVLPIIAPDRSVAAQSNAQRIIFTPTAVLLKKRKNISFTGFAQVHSTKQTIQSKPNRLGRPDDFAQQEYSKYGTEWQVGMMSQRQLSGKWSARLGLGYAQHTVTAQHNIRLRPRHGGGLGGPMGNDSLTFKYTVQTGSGIADIELRAVDKNPSPNPSNDNFDVQLTATEQSKSIVVPIGLEYEMFKLGRWSTSLQGTAVLSLPVSKGLKIDDLKLNGLIPLQLEPQNRQRADMRRGNDASLNASGQLGLAIAFAVKPNVAINVAPQVAYKLNKTLENGWASHSLSAFGVQLGLKYSL